MKASRIIAIALLAMGICTLNAVKAFGQDSFPEGSYSPVTNINVNSYPRVLADGTVMYRVNAPEAQKVQIDLCGTKYDMTKDEKGVWTVTTKP